MKTQQEKVIGQFEILSDKYHKMSLLFNELSKSINIELKQKKINPNSRKQIKDYLETLDLDILKIENLSKVNLSLRELKKEDKK